MKPEKPKQLRVLLRTASQEAYFWLERHVSPSTRYSQSHYEEQLRAALQPGIRWLDIGCGHQLLPEWRADVERELIAISGAVTGLDPDLSSLRRHRTIKRRVTGDAGYLPFADASFDLVTSNMVVEHLDHPEVCFGEVRRVLRPGGRFLFHTPNARAHTTRLARRVPESLKARLARILEGRSVDDVFRTYYRANTEERITDLAEATGFDAEWIRPTTTSAALAIITPLALLELLWIRLLETPRFSRWRQTLIVSLHRP